MQIVGELVIVAAGVLIIVVGRLAATGRIRRNQFAGIRTKRTMADDESWRIVHRGAQPWMIASGVLLVLTGAVAMAVTDESASAVVIGVGAVLTVVLTMFGSFVGLRALKNRPL